MGGIHGYDWSVFGGNPAPSDPDAVRAMGVRLRDQADSVEGHNRLLRSVGFDSESVWESPAARAFRPHLEKLPGQLDKLTVSYRDAEPEPRAGFLLHPQIRRTGCRPALRAALLGPDDRLPTPHRAGRRRSPQRKVSPAPPGSFAHRARAPRPSGISSTVEVAAEMVSDQPLR